MGKTKETSLFIVIVKFFRLFSLFNEREKEEFINHKPLFRFRLQMELSLYYIDSLRANSYPC